MGIQESFWRLFFLSYNAREIEENYGEYVTWGAQRAAQPPTNERFDGLVPPLKFTEARSEIPVAGDMLRRTGQAYGNMWAAFAHPYTYAVENSITNPEGMCSSFVDGSAGWVPFEDMRPMFQLTGGDTGQGAYWPNPTSSPNYGYL